MSLVLAIYYSPKVHYNICANVNCTYDLNCNVTQSAEYCFYMQTFRDKLLSCNVIIACSFYSDSFLPCPQDNSSCQLLNYELDMCGIVCNQINNLAYWLSGVFISLSLIFGISILGVDTLTIKAFRERDDRVVAHV